MKLKLSKAEMQCLEGMLSEIIRLYDACTMHEKLLVAILQKLYVKIAKALVVLQKEYQIKFDDDAALAFCVVFSEMAFYPGDHAHNLVLKLTNQFKQHYA